jgi:hypothetical protein
MVQARSLNLSGFHTSIVLISLSWMNNTDTFIYLLLVIQHHKSDPELYKNERIPQGQFKHNKFQMKD